MLILSICERPEILKIFMYVRLLINVIRVIVPILLIVFLSIDFMKGVTSDDNDVIKKLFSDSIKKFIAAVAIFFVPLVINVIFNAIGYMNSDVMLCVDNSTPEGIDITYENIANNRISSLKNTLSKFDYDSAKIAISDVENSEVRDKLLEELDELYVYVTLKSNINNLVNDYSDEKLKEYKSMVSSISDEDVKLNLEKTLKDVEKYIIEHGLNAPVITDITNDGVIVKVNVNKSSSDISGYYFSYTNKRPDKSTGGYLSTSNQSVDVVRLPGTTYVWVEDSSGNISSAKSITLSNDVLPITLKGYTVLKGTKLSDYLKTKGWSIDELNKLIARSVRAAGLHTKEGAATAAVSLQIVLIQKYGIKIPYWMGGKTKSFGAYSGWGEYRENAKYGSSYSYYGMDCGGFVNWSYYNAGVSYSSMNAYNYFLWPVKDNLAYSKENGEIGDIFRRSAINGHIEHVSIIVGKTENAFIVAEAYGASNGVVLSTYPYDKDNDYTIIKGERLFEEYDKISSSDYPSGF